MGTDIDLAARRVLASSELLAPLPSASCPSEPSSWESGPAPSPPPTRPQICYNRSIMGLDFMTLEHQNLEMLSRGLPYDENLSKQHDILQILQYDSERRPGITQLLYSVIH